MQVVLSVQRELIATILTRKCLYCMSALPEVSIKVVFVTSGLSGFCDNASCLFLTTEVCKLCKKVHKLRR